MSNITGSSPHAFTLRRNPKAEARGSTMSAVVWAAW
eukprot:CAMPEP_0170654014 /NCGR_PEP_ID=MMETSP0224-20130122/47704_1 /TAXON_ID=285029 /ORGANISM="Togula jolla, Strain CCCM 725" /LENGTH=35 /DNA_ID= /DNA_START= /DNA_END= /DNA_ORIENTATION=